MNIADYVSIVEKTDQLDPRAPIDKNFKLIPVLGLAGEIGSLLTELKKRVREPNRSDDIGSKRIDEELGDITWYAATISRRAGLNFAKDVLRANLQRIKQDPEGYLAARGAKSASGTDHSKGILPNIETFGEYQINAAKSDAFEGDTAALLPYLAKIWKNSSDLLAELDSDSATFSPEETKEMAKTLGDVMWYVAGFATLFGLDLGTIAKNNVVKAQSMFMPKDERVHTPLFDERFNSLERFPRVFDVHFVSTNEETAAMMLNGIRLGDPLRDNAYVGKDGLSDGYRFHDSVHLTLVAVLGWSPVIRGWMKRKRKSDGKVDDAEDGARAQIVEEMIVKLSHSYAVSIHREKLLDGRTGISMDLLKQIKVLTAGLEVDECKLWEWEKALLLGYEIFNKLRHHKGGRVRLDLNKRAITFHAAKGDEGKQFPSPAVV